MKKFNDQMVEEIQELIQQSKNNYAQKLREQIQKLEVYQIKEYVNNLFERQEQLQRRFQQNDEFQTNEINKLRREFTNSQISHLKDTFTQISEKQTELQNKVCSQIHEMNNRKDEIKNNHQSLDIIQNGFNRTIQNVRFDITKLQTNFENQKTQIMQLLGNLRNQTIEKLNKKISDEVDPIKQRLNQLFKLKTNEFQSVRTKIKSKAASYSHSKQKNNEVSTLKYQNYTNPYYYFKTPQAYNVQAWKWSQQLKSNEISINGNTVKLTKKIDYSPFSLLDFGFSKTLKLKKSWAIKIKKKTWSIYLGVCLKNKIQTNNFHRKGINWKETGHGFYMIGSSGSCFSNSQKEFNRSDKSFQYGDDDVIFMEYDPIDMRLRFNKNKEYSFEMPIIAPPQDDEYHPCVLLRRQNDSVELVLPQQFSSKNQKKPPLYRKTLSNKKKENEKSTNHTPFINNFITNNEPSVFNYN